MGHNYLLTDFIAVGRAYSFNGSSDYIDIGNDQSLKMTEALSISAWVKPNVFPFLSYHNIISDHGEGNNNTKVLRFYQNAVEFLLGPEGSTEVRYVFSNSIANQWQHITATYDGSFMRLFINGRIVDSASRTGTITANPLPVLIGKSYFNEYFPGSIDDIRIYNRAIFSEEVFDLYSDSTTYIPELIDSVYPQQNSNYLTVGENIKVFFNQPMNESTLTYNSISTHGNLTGIYELAFSYQSSTNTLEIQPTVPFKYGEQITVTLDSSIQSVSGFYLSPYVFQFNVKPETGSLKFAVADSFQLSFTPTNILSGDFNNDANIDVIVSSYDSSKYTFLLNNGSGGFTLGEEMSGVFKPHSISFTDIDNDRDLDMIVATNEENKIRVLRNTGQGIFNWVLPTIDANAPIATCPGDFDGDGDNDFVALLNYGHFIGRAYLYKNDGTGNFTESGYTSTGFPHTTRNVIGDIDNDGDLDIVAGNGEYFERFMILTNDGNGNFTYTNGPYIGYRPNDFGAGDFDGDFDLDFAICSPGLGALINDGNGVYTHLNLPYMFTQPANPIVADFDADGDLDFTVRDAGDWPDWIPRIGILKNEGSLSFTKDQTYRIDGRTGLTSADFDNNGSIDLAAINSIKKQVVFYKNCVDSLVAFWSFDGNINDLSGNL